MWSSVHYESGEQSGLTGPVPPTHLPQPCPRTIPSKRTQSGLSRWAMRVGVVFVESAAGCSSAVEWLGGPVVLYKISILRFKTGRRLQRSHFRHSDFRWLLRGTARSSL